MERFQDIKNIIRTISATNGLSLPEAIFIIEKVMENVFYGKYRVVFDDSYDLYAKNDDEKILISSLKDVRNIRHKIFLKVINLKNEYISNLRDSISLKEIVLEINKEADKLSTSKDWVKYNYLISKHIRGMIVSKTDEFYIVDIGVGKIAYLPLSEGYYEIFKRYPFFVKNVIRRFDEGFISIFLSKPQIKPKLGRSGKKLTEIFKDGKTGKFVNHKITVLVSDSFVWVYESLKKPVEHAETIYKKEFTKENNSRETALSEAEIFYRKNLTIKGVQLKVSDLFIPLLPTAFDVAGSFYYPRFFNKYCGI